MYCNQCGEQIDDGSRFCQHCGAQQKTDPNVAPAPGSAKPIRLSEGEPVAGAVVTPKNKAGQVIGIILAIVVVLAIVGSLSKPAPPVTSTSDPSTDALVANADQMADDIDNAAAIDETSKAGIDPWSYSTTEDKVRGSTTYFARTTSTNTVHQDSPYESDTTMSLVVRKSVADGTNVVLTISSGQMMCPSYEGCSGTVSFDGAKPERVRFSGPADNSSETIFVDGARSFIAKLKKAKKVVVEKTLYQAGQPQFEFDVHGLKWDH